MHIRYLCGLAAGIALASFSGAAMAAGFDPSPVYHYAYMAPLIISSAVVFSAVAVALYFGGMTRVAVLGAFATLSRVGWTAYRQTLMDRSLT